MTHGGERVFGAQYPRIVSDTSSVPEVYIPINRSRRSLAVLLATLNPSPEQEERDRIEAEAYRAERAAERETEMAALLVRHAELRAEHADAPILTVLLDQHAPQVRNGEIECDGCAPYWDHHDEEQQPGWPCSTWSAIEQGA